MNQTNCPVGYTDQSEFSTLPTCQIPVIWYLILKSVAIGIPGLIMISELIWLGVYFKEFMKKGPLPKVVMIWAIFQNLVMTGRPALNLGFGQTSKESMGIAFMTHISCALAAGIVVLFILIQMDFIAAASMEGRHNHFTESRVTILSIAGISQGLLFIVGPPLYKLIAPYSVFWTPVIIVDFTVIPYFAILGIIVRMKIAKMLDTKSVKISRRILIRVLICSAIGLTTGTMGLYAVFGTPYEWILVELCWISDDIFNGIIFTMFARKKKKSTITPESPPESTPMDSND